MKILKGKIDRDAITYSHRMHVACLAGMMTLWGVMARLTWWEYSWDVMEPCTFFITYLGSILCYTFYLATKTLPQYHTVRLISRTQYLKKLCR